MQTASVQALQGRWVFIAAHEEEPVTFQIGVVANDGVILASDKMAIHRVGSVDAHTIVDKIASPKHIPIAYCWAGEDEMMSAIMNKFSSSIEADTPYHSDTIIQLLDRASWYEWEQRYGSRLVLTTENPKVEITHRQSSLLLAYPCTDGVRLFRLGFSRTPCVRLVRDKTVEGDCGNTAAFFVERYYYQVQVRTVKALLPLVAHCILMGAKVNGNIEGLELAVCTPDKSRIIGDLTEARSFSNRLDSDIARAFGCP